MKISNCLFFFFSENYKNQFLKKKKKFNYLRIDLNEITITTFLNDNLIKMFSQYPELDQMINSFTNLQSKELILINYLDKVFGEHFIKFYNNQSEAINNSFKIIETSYHEYLTILKNNFLVESTYKTDFDVLLTKQSELSFVFNDMFEKETRLKKVNDIFIKEKFKYDQLKSKKENKYSKQEEIYLKAKENFEYNKNLTLENKKNFNDKSKEFKKITIDVWIKSFTKFISNQKQSLTYAQGAAEKMLNAIPEIQKHEDKTVKRLRERLTTWENETL